MGRGFPRSVRIHVEANLGGQAHVAVADAVTRGEQGHVQVERDGQPGGQRVEMHAPKLRYPGTATV